MPHLDTSTYASQIFWLLICFFLMMFIITNFIVPKIADIRQQRANKIDTYLRKAEQLREKTETAVTKYETALNNATQKANAELQKTKDELSQLITEKQNKLDKQLQQKIKLGEAEIEAEKAEALKEIKNLSTSLAVELLSKLNIKNVSMTDIKNTINHEVK